MSFDCLNSLPCTIEEWNIGTYFFIRPYYINCLLIHVLYWLQKLTVAVTFGLTDIIPQTHSVFGKRAFNAFTPASWSELQDHLKLERRIGVDDFKTRRDYLTSVCTRFTAECCWFADWCNHCFLGSVVHLFLHIMICSRIDYCITS